MKGDLAELAAALVAIVLGSALEEMLPHFAGVGFPVLLMSVLALAPRRRRDAALLFAIAAGGCEEAISNLPVAASVSFFAIAAVLSRTPRASIAAMSFAHPFYEAWLWLWRGAADADVFTRVFLAVPLGLVTAPAAYAALLWLDRRAAINEP